MGSEPRGGERNRTLGRRCVDATHRWCPRIRHCPANFDTGGRKITWLVLQAVAALALVLRERRLHSLSGLARLDSLAHHWVHSIVVLGGVTFFWKDLPTSRKDHGG